MIVTTAEEIRAASRRGDAMLGALTLDRVIRIPHAWEQDMPYRQLTLPAARLIARHTNRLARDVAQTPIEGEIVEPAPKKTTRAAGTRRRPRALPAG